jgi:predicted nucleic acid-binding protein
VELADTSVWAQRNHSLVKPWFEAASIAGDLAVCDMVFLEMMHFASTPARYREASEMFGGYPWVQMVAEDWVRAREVHGLLAARGGQMHRSVKIADLLIAAAAERSRLSLVHYDRDFETIAAVTGQPMRWIVPLGTI